MKTPFDTILRLRQRELENLRRELVQSVQEQSDIERDMAQISINMRREIEGHSRADRGSRAKGIWARAETAFQSA